MRGIVNLVTEDEAQKRRQLINFCPVCTVRGNQVAGAVSVTGLDSGAAGTRTQNQQIMSFFVVHRAALLEAWACRPVELNSWLACMPLARSES
jgi:hypothetical protein